MTITVLQGLEILYVKPRILERRRWTENVAVYADVAAILKGDNEICYYQLN